MTEVRAGLSAEERQLLALLEPAVGKPAGRPPERRGAVAILGGVSYVRESVGAISLRLAAAVREAKDAGPLEDLVVGEIGINLPARRYIVTPTSGRLGSGPFPLPKDFDYGQLLVGDAAASLPNGPLGDLLRAALAEYPRLALRGSFPRGEFTARQEARLEHLRVDDSSGILARLSHLSGTLTGGAPTQAELLIDAKGGDFYLASFAHTDQVLGPFELPASARSARGMAALRRRATVLARDGFERSSGPASPAVPSLAPFGSAAPSVEEPEASRRFRERTGLMMPSESATVAEAAAFVRRLSNRDRLELLRVRAPDVVVEEVLAHALAQGGVMGPAYLKHLTPSEELYMLQQERRAARLSQYELTRELHEIPRISSVSEGQVETPLQMCIRAAVLEQSLKQRFEGVRDFGL